MPIETLPPLSGHLHTHSFKTFSVGSIRINLIAVVSAVALAALFFLVVYLYKRRNAAPQPLLTAIPIGHRTNPPAAAPLGQHPHQPPATIIQPPFSVALPVRPPIQPSLMTPPVSSTPSSLAATSQPTEAQMRLREQYKAMIHDMNTLNVWDLTPGSPFDQRIDALEASSDPVDLLTELAMVYREDQPTRTAIDGLMASSWTLINWVKQSAIRQSFMKRLDLLSLPESAQTRRNVIVRLQLNEDLVNQLQNDIKNAPKDTQTELRDKLMMYFLSGLPPVGATAVARSSKVADHKSRNDRA